MFLAGARSNARLFAKSKIGMLGLAIIVFFVLLAVLAPYITTNNPVYSYDVSSPYSIPSWATIFPRYYDLAVTSYPVDATSFNTAADVSAFKYTGYSFAVASAPSVEPPGSPKGAGSLEVNATAPSAAGTQANPELPGGVAVFSMSKSFEFTTKPPAEFVVSAFVDPIILRNVSSVYVNFEVQSPAGNYSLSSTESSSLGQEIQISAQNLNTWKNVTVNSGLLPLSGIPAFAQSTNAAETVFRSPGTYTLTLQLQVVPSGTSVETAFYLTGIKLHIFGSAYGLLGTDIYGRDLWSQFVWGSQVSLLIGVLSAMGAVGLGTVTGLAAGYFGGNPDELISRVADFVLVLPFLPLAIVFISILGKDPALYKDIYAWVICLFVVLSWPWVTRVIRGQVLTVKERQYVEASRALGGGSGHIIRKHILPNVMGLVYSQTALSVSGFILLEAALDFLAISIHPIGTITWGLTLTNALSDALTNSAVDYAWWWFLPPAIAIASLSLAFVLVGFALDRVFNPRLRAR